MCAKESSEREGPGCVIDSALIGVAKSLPSGLCISGFTFCSDFAKRPRAYEEKMSLPLKKFRNTSLPKSLA